MSIYLMRWKNGDCSIVSAHSKDDAIIRLDEIGDANGQPIRKMEELMVHFRLKDDGYLELEGFGEETAETIWDFAYPLLYEAMDEHGNIPESAVGAERERVTQRVVREHPMHRQIRKELAREHAKHRRSAARGHNRDA